MFSKDGSSLSAKINVIIQKSSHGVMIPQNHAIIISIT